MSPGWRQLVVICGALAACSPAQRSGGTITPAPLDDQSVRAVIRGALAADARGESADSLYVIGASVIANGRPRLAPPRYAGTGSGGQIAVNSILSEITPGLAWVAVRYEWVGPNGVAEPAYATFVLEPLAGNWRIKHVHSSTMLPWEPKP